MVDFNEVLVLVKEAEALFSQVWDLKRLPSDNRDNAFRWFAMGYAGTKAENDVLKARIAELERNLQS